MKIYKDIKQGSEAWHKIKHCKIGGSKANQLLILSDSLLNELISEHCEDFDLQDTYESFDMQRGLELEPEARLYLNKYLNIKFKEVGWIESSENKILGISPDGITDCGKISCEIKCLKGKKHIQIIKQNEIPKEHIAQCLHYFVVNPKLEKHYFISYRPENIYKPACVFLLEKNTLVDIGWTYKGKIKQDRGLGIKEYVSEVKDIRTVAEWCKLMLENAKLIKEKIDFEIENLKF